jgi:mannan endo-1,4-beta-mannosidase
MFGLLLLVKLGVVFGLGNGVNLQPSYYNNGNVTFGWSLMQNYSQIKSVRVEIEPYRVTQAVDWLSQASKQGYSIIATYHKSTVLGSDDPNELNEAANWWVTNYQTLHEAADFTINLMNEWGSHSQTAETYSSAYNNAVSIVREVYDGEIVIDIPGWGQETHTAALASPLLTGMILLSQHHTHLNFTSLSHLHNSFSILQYL